MILLVAAASAAIGGGIHYLRNYPLIESSIGYDVWAFEGIERLSTKFLRDLSRGLLEMGVDPNAVLAVMKHESNFKADAKNIQQVNGKPHLIAAGLIQFIDDTARKYGRTVEQVADMDAEEQLPLILRYWGDMAKTFPSRRGMWTPEQALRATFYPASVGKPGNYVIGDSKAEPKDASEKAKKAARKSRLIYEQNKGLDRNKDGLITASDVDEDAVRTYAAAKSRPTIRI